jgi:cell division protein FtsB
LLLAIHGFSQQPDMKAIKIRDTLTLQEKNSRNIILLRTELDSLVKLYNTAKITEPVPSTALKTQQIDLIYVFALGGIIILLIGWIIFSLHRQHRIVRMHLRNSDGNVRSRAKSLPTDKRKLSLQVLEEKISDLNAELHKLTRENEGLNRVVKEYNGIQHEYDSLKHGINKAYKIKNYPGYDKGKAETAQMQSVLDTENAVANYAYEKFLRPVLAIVDNNKNNPAKMDEQSGKRLLDLLVSLALLYIEYLYLRVNDLAIGGKMVERIHALSNGKPVNPALLKKLNTDHGSRALVMKMALDKMGIERLSYPVFDETDLNPQ